MNTSIYIYMGKSTQTPSYTISATPMSPVLHPTTILELAPNPAHIRPTSPPAWQRHWIEVAGGGLTERGTFLDLSGFGLYGYVFSQHRFSLVAAMGAELRR